MKLKLSAGFFTLFSLYLLLHPLMAQDSSVIIPLESGHLIVADWRPDGKVLAIGGSMGLWLSDEHYELISQIDMPLASTILNLHWSPGSLYLAVVYNRALDPKETLWEIWQVSEDGLRSHLINSLSVSPARYGDFHLDWHPDGLLLSTSRGVLNIFTQDISYLYRVPRLENWTDTVLEIYDGTNVWWNEDSSQFVGLSHLRTGSEAPFGVFDALTGEMLVELSGESMLSSTFVWSPDSTKVTDSYRIWDTRSGEIIARVGDGFFDIRGGIRSVWSPDSRTLFTLLPIHLPLDPMSTFYITDAVSGHLLNTQTFWPYLHSLQWHDKHLVAYSTDGHLFIVHNSDLKATE